MAPDEHRSRLRPAMPRIGREQPIEITVVGFRWIDSVERLFFPVVVAERLAELVQRIEPLPRGDQRPFPRNFVHQLVDIFQLPERGPTGVARPPVRTRPQPHRKGLGEIFGRVALRIPAPKVLDITPAGRIGSVIARVVFRGRAEQLLPAPAALQLVGVLHGVASLMAENGHALGPGAPFNLEHHFLLELHQARMGEIEWDRNARHTIRTEPLARYPRVRPQPDAPLFELFMELVEAVLEPGPFNHDPQTAEPALEQVLIGQRFPVVSSARHRASKSRDIRCLDPGTGACRRQPSLRRMAVSTRPRLRSRSVNLTPSMTGSVCPRSRPMPRQCDTAQECHSRTPAPQQKATLFDHFAAYQLHRIGDCNSASQSRLLCQCLCDLACALHDKLRDIGLRFFNVTMPTGPPLIGKATGNSLIIAAAATFWSTRPIR